MAGSHKFVSLLSCVRLPLTGATDLHLMLCTTDIQSGFHIGIDIGDPYLLHSSSHLELE